MAVNITMHQEDQEAVAEMVRYLETPRYVVIVSHRNPDGDAIGSSLAVYHMLRGLGHSAQVIVPSPYPVVFDWMAGVSDVMIYDQDASVCQERVQDADLVIALDFNALDRIDHLGKVIAESGKVVWMIDHHMDPEPFADIAISRTSASSTCEMVYQWMIEAGWKHLISEDVASCLQVGLLTDTGGYRHNTNPIAYTISGELKAIGVDDYSIYQRVMDTSTEKQLRLLGHALANRMEILPAYHTGIIALTREDYTQFEIQRGDTEGIVNYLLKIPGIHVAALIMAQPKLVKLSLRSKGDFSVQQLASEHFNGGGHFNASGGYMYKPLNVVVDHFKAVVPDYMHFIKEKHITS